jgi:large subunit ribosomal protein L44e
MKMPKTKNIYCPKCKTHTPHRVSIYKKGKDRKMAQSKRRYDRKKAGYGGQPKPIQHNQAKANKKTRPMYKCSKCGQTVVGKAQRLKKFEIIAK